MSKGKSRDSQFVIGKSWNLEPGTLNLSEASELLAGIKRIQGIKPDKQEKLILRELVFGLYLSLASPSSLLKYALWRYCELPRRRLCRVQGVEGKSGFDV